MVDFPRARPGSVLFITLDSCRFDTFVAAKAPHLKSIGPLYRAQAPSYFTYASHAAMFAGFTPGIAGRAEPFVNPKFGKIFKLAGAGFPSRANDFLVLSGRSIIAGFGEIGHLTLGSGALGWFNPETPTGKLLMQDFQQFYYPGDTWSLRRQVQWLAGRIGSADGPVFAFLNVGETHVPYYFEGASWPVEDNPCVPFAETNDAKKCRVRQRACLEFVDRELEGLLAAFRGETVLVCADHGDCWGEDGLWEHGISHPAVLTVPLLFCLRQQ